MVDVRIVLIIFGSRVTYYFKITLLSVTRFQSSTKADQIPTFKERDACSAPRVRSVLVTRLMQRKEVKYVLPG